MAIKKWVFILTLPLYAQNIYAAGGDKINQLQLTISLQQAQLARQARAISSQEALLNHLSKRVAQLSSNDQARTPAPAYSSKQLPLSRGGQVAIPGDSLVFGSKKSQISISGQVNVVGFQANDGRFNRTYIGTNSVSNSRVNIDSKHVVSSDLTVGSNLQLGFKTNPSASINQINPSASSIDIRRMEAYIKSKQWGGLFFGKGNTASDDTAYADLSGTMLANRATVEDIGGGLYFGGLATNPQISDVFNGLDGLSRKVRVRYNTPTFAGLSVSTSLVEGDQGNAAPYNDVALNFANSFGATKVVAELAYTSPQNISSGANLARGKELNTSASILLPVGISLTGAAGKVSATQLARKNPHYYYVKPGYQFNYFSNGLTAFSVSYGKYYNFDQNDDTGTAQGFQAIQNFDKLDLAVYGGYQVFKLNRPGAAQLHNIDLFMLGAVYKF